MGRRRGSITFLALAGLLLLGTPAPAPGQQVEELRRRLADDYGIELNGFLEGRSGWRLDRGQDERDAAIGEARLQLDAGKYLRVGSLKLKVDLVADAIDDEVRPELREANYLFSPTAFMDLKLGRQVLTWGTGDLLFINDLFPKDWESFFIGRDDEYLKAPSDAARMSLFLAPFNIDFVYAPRFVNSRYIDGERLSYWNGPLNRLAGRDFIMDDHQRNRVFRDSDYAMRIFKNIDGTEYALYGYHGFWSTPEGLDPAAFKLIYPKLSVYGGSIRGGLAGGIANLELGYYHSRDDENGADPAIRNSEIRLLAGYERELARDFTGSVQYYLEAKEDYDAYRGALSPGSPEADQYRHLLTMRLTKLLMNQNLKLSFFVYYSPSDKDAYLRPKVHYKITDQWAAEMGGNLFFGSDDHTFWGQFGDNSSMYAGLRWNF